MNSGIYRLVFNATRGLWMVVSEHVAGHQSSATTARSERRAAIRAQQKTQGQWVSVYALIVGVALTGNFQLAFADPNLPANTIPDASKFVNTQGITTQTINSTLNIQQSTLKGIIKTPDFNIGTQGAVNFNHLVGNGNASTLVKINGPRTIIEGALNAPNGSVYLINQNGVLFANGARVNVNGLVASALNISDDDYLSDLGLLNGTNANTVTPTIVFGAGENANPLALVMVEPDANIKSALGGSIMLFGPQVINQGSLEATEGQVLMAAGEKVYLSYAPDLNSGTNKTATYSYAEDSPYNSLAGILVEVDSFDKSTITTTEANKNDLQNINKVTNDTMGRILSKRGNVTLAGFMVNQSGRITATSAAGQKGSIRLLARDTVEKDINFTFFDDNNPNTPISAGSISTTLAGVDNKAIAGTRTGELTLGKDSITAVLPEDEAALYKVAEIYQQPQLGEPSISQAARDKGETTYTEKVLNAIGPQFTKDENGKVVKVERTKLTDDQAFVPNLIEMVGRRIYVGDNAKVVNPSGNINIYARKEGQFFDSTVTVEDPDARIYFGKNSLIDASGLQNVGVAMESNFVELLLTNLDLKDDPINNLGFLYREKVWLDIRNVPDKRVADIAGFVNQVGRTLGEKSAVGGTLNIKSEGTIVQDVGATFDVSGGSILYKTGLNKETWLLDAAGNRYALGNAPTDILFTGFLGDKNAIDKTEGGYTEGKAAGDLNIESHQLALAGNLKGGAIYGERQANSNSLGGQLSIKVAESGTKKDIAIVNSATPINRLVNADPVDDVNTVDNAIDNPNSIHDITQPLIPVDQQQTIELSASQFNNSGFEQIALNTQGNITVDAKINATTGAQLDFTGENVTVNQDIVAKGGKISLTAQVNDLTTQPNDTRNIQVADGVTLDASGMWVNQVVDGVVKGRVLIDGGTVNLSSADLLSLGTNSLVNVSGGATLAQGGKVKAGDAGAIHIASQVGQDGEDKTPFSYIAPQLNGSLRAYALVGGQGGQLSITAPFVTIGNQGFGDARELWLNTSFFQNGGFTSYALAGRDGVIVREGTMVDVASKNYVLNTGYRARASGSDLHDMSSVQFLPEALQSSTSISLSTVAPESFNRSEAYADSGISRGSVHVEKDATIKVASHGTLSNENGDEVNPSIKLGAWDNAIFVDGTLQAKGGDIQLTMNAPVTPSDFDTGYNASQVIWLTDNAKLDASGYVDLTPNNKGLIQGEVYNGGNINISANKGYVIAQSGALLDASGATANLDIQSRSGQYVKTPIASNGGNIQLNAREGMLIDANLNAQSPGALNGELTLRLSRNNQANLSSSDSLPISQRYPSNKTWAIELDQAGTYVPTNLAFGDNLEALAGSTAKISANTIMAAGLSDVSLKSESAVRFNGNVDLNVAKNLTINSTHLEATENAQVNLNANVITLANTNDDDNNIRSVVNMIAPTAVEPAAQGSNATFNANAHLINVDGHFAINQFASSQLNSQGDLRLSGYSYRDASTNITVKPTGSLNTSGELTLDAKQIYPTTLSNFDINVTGDNGKVIINNSTGKHNQVLSAMGNLTINAKTIDQNGVLKAPFGSITFNADTLNLNAGSLSSVSAEGALIPFGMTLKEGLDYIYQYGPYTAQFKPTANFNLESNETDLVNFADKQVVLNAKNINQNTDSNIDISGGGDLFAYEWIPGIGGSQDSLANNVNPNVFGGNATQTWAIMPNSPQNFASYDKQYWNGSALAAGDSVYLSGVEGLAAGYYTLMPARYALLPGAKLVTAVNNAQDLPVGINYKLDDGGVMTSGYTASLTTDGYVRSSRTSGFVVRDGDYANQLSEYQITNASQYFINNTQVQQTADAGRLSIQAINKLVLQGNVLSAPSGSGKGSEVDIAANKILVVANGEQEGEVTLDGETYLAIGEEALSGLNASSLLLGGVRKQGDLTVSSTDIRVGDKATLSGSEVILAATDNLTIEQGATVKGQGLGASAKDLNITDLNGNSDSAVLRVSGEKSANYTRNNPNGARGDLLVEQGALVAGDGSILLNATNKNEIKGDVIASENTELALVAKKISLGSPENDEAVIDGLWLNQNQTNAISSAGKLTLESQSTIDLYGDISIGNQSADITLKGAGLAGYQNTGEKANIVADKVELNNQNNVAFAAPTALENGTVPTLGQGELTINANQIAIGDNQVAIKGYDQVNLTANQAIVLQGGKTNGAANTTNQSSTFAVDKNLTITTGKLTADNGVNAAILANQGSLVIQGNVGEPVAQTSSASVAAQVSLSGERVVIAGVDGANNSTNQQAAHIALAGGRLKIDAVGAQATDDITIGNGANIDVSAVAYEINNKTVNVDAGSVSLSAAKGSIEVAQGANIDLSGLEGANAGEFAATAENGGVQISANTLNATGEHGRASIDANTLDFGETAQALNDFNGVQTYRVRQGNVVLDTNQTIKSQQVAITVDNGAITVNGKIDASGDKGGSIGLYAQNDITINAQASVPTLSAQGNADKTTTTGTLGDGGRVVLSSSNGGVSVAAANADGGAVINVAGDQNGEIKGSGGVVTYRVNADNVNHIDAQSTAGITGAKAVYINPFKTSNESSLNQANINTIETDLAAIKTAFAANAYQQTQDGVNASIRPEAVINSNEDLTVSGNLKLTNQNVLTLQASNNLIINGNIDALGSAGASVNLVAGADTSSANPLTVNGYNQATGGNINLIDSIIVRTDSGDIQLAASNDINLGNSGSNGAAVYSKGIETEDTNGFNRLKTVINANANAQEYYGANGGNVTIKAHGDLIGSTSAAQNQTTIDWFANLADSNIETSTRAANVNRQTRWYVLDEKAASNNGILSGNGFKNGIATFGGGDVTIEVGKGISHLQVATATNGRMGGDGNVTPDISNLTVQGGGDVALHAGGSVENALIHSGYGQVDVNANQNASLSLSIMDAQVDVKANLAVTINGVVNSTTNQTKIKTGRGSGGTNNITSFYSYGEDSSLNLASNNGDIKIIGSSSVFPSQLNANAPLGSVSVGVTDNLNVNAAVNLYPSKLGNVSIVAGQNIDINNLTIADIDPTKLPTIVSSGARLQSALPNLLNYIGADAHAEDLLFLNNNQSNLLFAGNDINFVGINPIFVSPKKISVIAGNDISNANLVIQNVKSTDVSEVIAGRDILYDAPKLQSGILQANNGSSSISISGPGRLNVEAGRDVDLQASRGILSVGNAQNPFLSEQGADLQVYAGAASKTDYDAMIAAYLSPESSYAGIYQPKLTAYMQDRTGDTTLDNAQALSQFKQLSKREQTDFINTVFFDEVKAGGVQAGVQFSDDFGDYSRSERAILTMFPDFTQNKEIINQKGSISAAFEAIAKENVLFPGDIKLFYSQIKSERGGDIEILAPGGLVNAGLAVSSGLSKQDADLGIITLRGGEIQAVVRDDVTVNQSRIFTLGGNDMLLYSALADIDAGRGEKTATATPPPSIRIVNGQVVLDYSGAVSGSGIATFLATGSAPDPDDKGPTPYLFAPYGTINAGEAGIRSAGDVFIGARIVIGADNISAAGSTSGVPSVSSNGLSLAVPASANNPAAGGDQAESAGDGAKEGLGKKLAAMPSLISVEVLSLGDESPSGSAGRSVNCSNPNDQSKNCSTD